MNHFDIAHAQSKAWSLLSRSFTSKRVASTYLLLGGEGLGDWPLAIEFAALLNCASPQSDDTQERIAYPCGACPACRSIRALNFEGLHLIVPISKHKNADEAIDRVNDVLEEKRRQPLALLDRSTPINIPIAMARDIKKSLSRKSAEGITRVVILYQMELMRRDGADAMLKLIEEPPPNTVLILTATRADQLAITIQSRAQRVRLESMPEQLMTAYLESEYKLAPELARLRIRLADGHLGRAIAMADGDDSDNANRRGVGLLLFRSLFADSNATAVGQALDLMGRQGRGDIEELLRLWQTLIRDAAYFAGSGDDEGLINIDFSAELIRLSRFFADPLLAGRMATTIKNALADLRLNVHIQPALANLILLLRTDIFSKGAGPIPETVDG